MDDQQLIHSLLPRSSARHCVRLQLYLAGGLQQPGRCVAKNVWGKPLAGHPAPTLLTEDQVSISNARGTYEIDYTPNWSTEEQVLKCPTAYTIADLNGVWFWASSGWMKESLLAKADQNVSTVVEADTKKHKTPLTPPKWCLFTEI